MSRVIAEITPDPTDVVVANLPAGSVLRVHHASGPRDYTADLPDLPMILVIPGDPKKLGWGCYVSIYSDVRRIRAYKHRLDRPAWEQAVKLVRKGGIAVVRHEQQDYYGRPRWTSVKAEPVEITPAKDTVLRADVTWDELRPGDVIDFEYASGRTARRVFLEWGGEYLMKSSEHTFPEGSVDVRLLIGGYPETSIVRREESVAKSPMGQTAEKVTVTRPAPMPGGDLDPASTKWRHLIAGDVVRVDHGGGTVQTIRIVEALSELYQVDEDGEARLVVRITTTHGGEITRADDDDEANSSLWVDPRDTLAGWAYWHPVTITRPAAE